MSRKSQDERNMHIYKKMEEMILDAENRISRKEASEILAEEYSLAVSTVNSIYDKEKKKALKRNALYNNFPSLRGLYGKNKDEWVRIINVLNNLHSNINDERTLLEYTKRGYHFKASVTEDEKEIIRHYLPDIAVCRCANLNSGNVYTCIVCKGDER